MKEKAVQESDGVEGWRGSIAGNEIGQLEKIAAIERNVLDSLLSDLALEHGLREVDGLSRRGHIDRCHFACGGKGCIQRKRTDGLKRDARILHGCKALETHFGSILAGQKIWYRIGPV